MKISHLPLAFFFLHLPSSFSRGAVTCRAGCPPSKPHTYANGEQQFATGPIAGCLSWFIGASAGMSHGEWDSASRTSVRSKCSGGNGDFKTAPEIGNVFDPPSPPSRPPLLTPLTGLELNSPPTPPKPNPFPLLFEVMCL